MALTLSNLKQALSQIASKAGATKAAILLFNAIGGGGGAVTSVFGRVGAVVAAIGDYTFAQIGSTPTTLGGYGITDGVSTSRQVNTTSPITGGGDLSANRTLALDVSVDHSFTALQTITKAQSTFNSIAPALALYLNRSDAVGGNGLGAAVSLGAESSTTDSTLQGQVATAWSDATHASRTAYMDFLLVNAASAAASKMRLFPSGGLSVNNTTDPGAGIISANTGYWTGTAASTSGKILKSDGSKFTASGETYAAPGTSGNILTSDGTNWLSSAPASPVAPLTLTLTNATTNIVDDILILDHESSGTPAANFGGGIAFKLKSNATANRDAGELRCYWVNAADANRDSRLDVFLESNGSASLSQVARFGALGEMAVGASSTLAALAGVISADTGFVIAGAKPALGKFLLASASLDKYKNSPFSVPTASGTSGKIWQWNGTDVVTSAATWPTAVTTGYQVQADGTNYISYPTALINSNTADQTGFAADTYITGSNVTVAAGDWKAKGQYHVRFDMTKTAAGVATPIINVRIGTGANASDTSILTFTLGAGTAAVDTAVFDLWVTFRSVGSGTAAVVQGTLMAWHTAATGTGITNTADKSLTPFTLTTSAGFASNLATQLGISFNGGTSFAGTLKAVDASLMQ